MQRLLAAPAAKPFIQRTPGETDEQRLQRQAATTIGLFSRMVSQADEKGWDGITLVIAHTGREIEPRGMEKHGPRKPRASGIIVKSASSIAKDHLEPALEWLMMGGPSEAVIEFKRDARGVMQFKKWERRALPPVAKGGSYRPKTEREMLDEHGIPNPQKIWSDIGKKWEEEVKDAGKMVLTFGPTEVATWIVGGLLKVLGVGLGRLRHLYRLIKGRNTKAVAEGLVKLGKGEADELGQLLNRVNRGERLNQADTKRLEELAGRLDDPLAPAAKTGQQAADKAKPGGGSTPSKSPSTKFDDEPTVPDAKPAYPGAARPINQSTRDYYKVVDSANPVFSAEAQLVSGGELKIVLRTEFGGDKSAVLRGHEQFQAILKHFGGRAKGIRGEWTYETNLATFNELIRAGKSETAAALGTKTGGWAKAAGFPKVTVRSLKGTPGNYTEGHVLFYP